MIHVVDTIGEHSGMRHYNDDFRSVLVAGGWDVEVLSNFSGEGIVAKFDNFYQGKLAVKLFGLTVSFARYLVYWVSRSGKQDWWIYQSYGLRSIDLLFLLPLLLRRKRLVLLVHDVYSVTKREGKIALALKRWVYAKCLSYAIVHSALSRQHLVAAGFKGQVVDVPLFRSGAPGTTDILALPLETQALTRQPGVYTLLFFGTIRKTKGLDIAIAAIKGLPMDVRAKVRLIVAGQDLERVLNSAECAVSPGLPVTVLSRYLDDNELNYLFEQADAILLPYREIYQSAVLDVAVGYRVPFIASNLAYFTDVKNQYPTFGHIFGQSAEDLSNFLSDAIPQWRQLTDGGFCEKDVIKYYSIEHSEIFLSGMRKIMTPSILGDTNE